MRGCIVGVGNEICRDDAIGLEVVGRLKVFETSERIDFLAAGIFPISLPKLIQEYRKILIIDALPPGLAPGRVIPIKLNHCGSRGQLYSLHDVDLWLELSSLKSETNNRVLVLGIETGSVEFGYGITEAMRRVLPRLIEEVREYQRRFLSS